MIKKRPRKKYTQEEVDNYEITDYPTNKKFKDLQGEVFGKWEVIKYAGKDGSIHAKWFCLCTGCGEGNIQKVLGNHLKKGVTTSCGCAHAEKVSEVMSTSWEDKQKYLNSWKEEWVLVDYVKREGKTSLFIFDCPSCNTLGCKLPHSSLILRSGGCRCTMLSTRGFDYNQPAWFYLMKYSAEDTFYWKYGVTQKESVEERNHKPVEEVKREIIFAEVIRDRWNTISLESDFKEFFTLKGKTCTTKGEVLGNGNTECFHATDIPSQELISFFWSLEPKVIPFTTSSLKDITCSEDSSLAAGVIKYFNLCKKERPKWYLWLESQNIKPKDVDLNNPYYFNKVYDEFIIKIRPT